MKSCTGEQQLIDFVTGTRVEPLYEDCYGRGGSEWCCSSWHCRASRRYVTDADNMCYESLPCPLLFVLLVDRGAVHPLKWRILQSLLSSAIIQANAIWDVT